MAVNKRVLAASLAAAVAISVGGGFLLSRTSDSSSATASSDDVVTISSNGVYTEPGIPTNKVVQGKPLPIVDLTDNDGNTISTADLIGHPLVINVWATTCEPCKREMPALAAVQAELGDQVRFVGVNTAANTPSALAFAQDKGVHYELLSDLNGNLQTALGVTGLPYTIFVSSNGTIVAQKGLELDQATIRSTITDTLLP